MPTEYPATHDSWAKNNQQIAREETTTYTKAIISDTKTNNLIRLYQELNAIFAAPSGNDPKAWR